MDKKLKDCFGCLSKYRTPDGVAVRRYPPERDEDAYLLDFGSPYSIDAFQKILLSKTFRRLNYKTQVFTANVNAHVRTRSSHTYEVVSIATAIARILGLNENLCQAIALGHDIGHVPFGHTGEKFISKITGKNFRHEVFSAVIAQKIERKGGGLNLTHQVLEGILNHSRGAGSLWIGEKMSPEAAATMFADKIAYIWADINDIFVKTKFLNINDFPELGKLVNECGKDQRERVAFCIKNLCCESAEKGAVSFTSSTAAQIFSRMKELMYLNFYETLRDIASLEKVLGRVYKFLAETPIIKDADPAIVLSLMTDNDVLSLNSKNVINAEDFYGCSVTEILPYLKGKDIDFTDPDLDW